MYCVSVYFTKKIKIKSLTQQNKMCVIMQWCTIAMRDALCSVFKICTRYTNPVSARLSVHAGSSLYWEREIEGDFGSYVQLLIYRRCLYLICFRVVKRGISESLEMINP